MNATQMIIQHLFQCLSVTASMATALALTSDKHQSVLLI